MDFEAMLMFKLGKKPVKLDNRNIKFSKLLKVELLPTIPESYDCDRQNICPEQMFGNDQLGDCVLAARANQTLRFQFYQQNCIVPITTQDCVNEYYSEEGGQVDEGLVMLDSLNEWRQKGWPISDGHTYSIDAFASLDFTNLTEVKAGIYLLNGLQTGMQVPQSAMDQFQSGLSWDIVDDDGGNLGGHAIYIVGFNLSGPVCVSWSKKQQMSWNFWTKYVDECYGVVDNMDSWVARDPLDIPLLQQYLDEVTK
jgi:hypothetical protein